MSTGFNPNPYQPPSYPTQDQWAQTQGPAQVSPAIIESLGKTRPWVLLIAILGSIWTGLFLLGGLGILVAARSTGIEFGMGIGYLFVGGLYLTPLVLMYRYCGAINRVMNSGGQHDLEQAIDAQRLFWQVMGILTLIGIVLGVLMVIGAVAFAAAFSKAF